ncbi:MAG: TonB C-terminal domain-containing protein [Zoogloeaceae bacterium]|jgi:colicin import membrane protein|nr:TonB C-terminal domain-containing protein [Zoogloeaceae bacterium]
MNETPPEPGRKAALIITVAVHSLLVLALFFGLQWQRNKKDAPVEVELWSAKSAQPAVQMPAPRPEPMPEIRQPPPPKEVKPIPKPDIAVKPEKKEPPKQEPPKPEPVPKRPDFSSALEEELQEIRQSRQESERLAQAEAAANERARESWVGKIKAKISSNIVLPPNVTNNPEAVFLVYILPSGEINAQNPPRLVQSSGIPTLDDSFLRAIWKSSPFPLPDNSAVFRRDLKLILRPYED